MSECSLLRIPVFALNADLGLTLFDLFDPPIATRNSIQVDMNNRKAESKEEQNNLEQEIQDLNNRFTISLSDLK